MNASAVQQYTMNDSMSILYVHICVCLYIRESPIGIIAISQMAAGDGLADIVGRYSLNRYLLNRYLLDSFVSEEPSKIPAYPV